MTDLNKYDRVIYFGVTANSGGINREEAGYKNIGVFAAQAPAGKKKYLTVRMLDFDTNINILRNESLWPIVFKDTLDIAEDYHFNGIVLDLEMSGIVLVDVSGKINKFVQSFYSSARRSNLDLAMTVYGDKFYRKRPYDMKALGETVDEVFVMAYDFHKSMGEPGPNFPFRGKEKYNYDFQQMVEDFTKYVPKEKLTLIFGMYGYEWVVDEKKKPIRPARALTLNEIRKKYLNQCQWQDCVIKRDMTAQETEINYVESEMKDDFAYIYYHVIWFEDEESVRVKTSFLKEKGINSISYWAEGYF
jgi:spore germination protein YaaH